VSSNASCNLLSIEIVWCKECVRQCFEYNELFDERLTKMFEESSSRISRHKLVESVLRDIFESCLLLLLFLKWKVRLLN